MKYTNKIINPKDPFFRAEKPLENMSAEDLKSLIKLGESDTWELVKRVIRLKRITVALNLVGKTDRDFNLTANGIHEGMSYIYTLPLLAKQELDERAKAKEEAQKS